MPIVVLSARPPVDLLDVIKIQDWDRFYDEIQTAQRLDDDGCDPLTCLLVVLFIGFLLSFVLVPCALLVLWILLLLRLHSIKATEVQWEEVRRIMHSYNDTVFKKYGVAVVIVVDSDDQAVMTVIRFSEEK